MAAGRKHQLTKTMALPEVGKYLAALDGQPVLTDRADENPPKSGLQLFLPCIVVEEGSEKGKTIAAFVTLVDKDGTVQVNTWNKLLKIFGPHAEPAEMFAPGVDHADARFEIDVQDHTYEGKTTRRVQWINVPGEGPMPNVVASDVRAVKAKYGSKFRALTGGTPAKAKAPTTPQLPPAPPAPTEACTMQDAWNELNHSHAGKSPDDIKRIWFDAIRSTGKDQQRFTSDDWAALRNQFRDNVPM